MTQLSLVQVWIPALDGAEAKLRAAARVADVGCGSGAATILLARAFPESSFAGFDRRHASVARARRAAAAAGIVDRVQFHVADAMTWHGRGHDLVTFLNGLDDVDDPVGALDHAREALTHDGSVLVVEPGAGDGTERQLRLAASAAGFTRVRRLDDGEPFHLLLELRR